LHKTYIPYQTNEKAFLIRKIRANFDAVSIDEHPHRHEFTELMYIQSGTGKHEVDGKEYNLNENTIYIISKGQVHNFLYAKDIKGILIRFGKIIYDVQIEENELDIDCFCTCDFDTGGLCAHAVAVCLNILDEQYEEIETASKADLEETVEIIDYRLKDGKNFYKNVFKTATENTQDNFLKF